MKYIKTKVQEQNGLNNIFALITYIEYNKTLRAVVLYTIQNIDNLYLTMEERHYDTFLQNFVKEDVVVLDKICFTRPFEDLFENISEKKKNEYEKIHEEIRKKADLLNNKK